MSEGTIEAAEAAEATEGTEAVGTTETVEMAETAEATEGIETTEAVGATEATETAEATETTEAIATVEETAEDPAAAAARSEMEAVIEAVLFVAAEPVSRGRLLEIFEQDEREAAAQALEAVVARYGGGEGRGVMLEEVAGGIRLATRPELVGWLRRFFEVSGGSKLSMAALETLAIVAYRQPVTGPEIQELRSVNSTGVLSTLLQRRLVRIAGRKEVVGKPFLYATTREFLVHFGLKSLKDLPPLEEFEETFGEAAGSPAGIAAEAISSVGVAEAGEEGADREERFLREAAALEETAEMAEEAGEVESLEARPPEPALPAEELEPFDEAEAMGAAESTGSGFEVSERASEELADDAELFAGEDEEEGEVP